MAEWIRIPRQGLGDKTRVEGADGHKYALFHIGDEFYAIDDTCTHEEASLSEGTVYDDEDEPQVECPKHGAIFDVATGEVRSLPAVRSVRSYDTRLEGDDVLVSTEPRT